MRALLEDVAAFTASRCRLAGAGLVYGGVHNTFRATFMVVAEDLEPVRSGLETLLERGDAGPLQNCMRNAPPVLRASDQRPWGF